MRQDKRVFQILVSARTPFSFTFRPNYLAALTTSAPSEEWCTHIDDGKLKRFHDLLNFLTVRYTVLAG